MFKKIRNKIYNRKTIKKLDLMKFDTFSYYGDSKVPAFISERGREEVHTVFFPETEKTFKVAFTKLKKRYFKKFPYVLAKENVERYCEVFEFGKETANFCLEIFKIRAEYFQSENKNNKSVD